MDEDNVYAKAVSALGGFQITVLHEGVHITYVQKHIPPEWPDSLVALQRLIASLPKDAYSIPRRNALIRKLAKYKNSFTPGYYK